MEPKVSVIIVNYNGDRWIEVCLTSLLKQTYKNFEIIIVDNGSTDSSLSKINKYCPRVKMITNKSNLGFAEGNNIGYGSSSGKYILLLNNDTEVEENFIKNFVDVFREKPEAGIAQSKIILMKDKKSIDSCGSFWTDTTFMYYVGNGKNKNVDYYNKPFKVFSVKGASMLIKREVVEKIGLFDPVFWNYYEETDFCHRAWLAGYESWYWPLATCYHAQGGTSLTFPNDQIQYNNFKNKLLSFLKNFECTTLFYYIPVFLFLNILIGIVWLMNSKFRHVGSLYRAIWWNVINIGNTFEKRRVIQKLRKYSDRNIFGSVKKNPRPIYYLYLLNDKLRLYQD